MSWNYKARGLAVAVATVLLFLILGRLDFQLISRAFMDIRWGWVLCVLVLNVLNTWIEAVRWKVILSSVSQSIRVLRAFYAILVGVVGNVTLPLRFGDGARAYFLAKTEKISFSSSFSTVLLDRISDIVFFFILCLATASFFSFPHSVRRAGIIAGILLCIGLMALAAMTKFVQHLKPRPKGKIWQKVQRELISFAEGLSALKNRNILLPAIVLSAISWLVRLAMVWAMLRAFELTLPLIAPAVILVFINLGIALVNTPANLGGFELSAVAGFKLLSVDTGLAVSFAIALHMIEIVPMFLLGIGVLWLSGHSVRSLAGVMGPRLRP